MPRERRMRVAATRAAGQGKTLDPLVVELGPALATCDGVRNPVPGVRVVVRHLLVTAVFACAAVTHADETTPPIPKIEQEVLLERIEQKDASLIVLDVRSPEEFAAGHIPGAINIPYTHLPARVAELRGAGDKDIVLYCATGVRTERAAERMRAHGYTRLLHLDGDMKAWQEQRRPEAK